MREDSILVSPAPWAKLRLAAEILLIYVQARWAMGKEELEPLVARLRASKFEPVPLSQADRIHLAATVMHLLGVLPTDSRCLVRSLVLLSLLQRRGLTSTLVIGVRSEPDFAAHAWIEYGAEALLPTGGGEFARLTEI